jgi:hypothetical protein
VATLTVVQRKLRNIALALASSATAIAGLAPFLVYPGTRTGLTSLDAYRQLDSLTQAIHLLSPVTLLLSLLSFVLALTRHGLTLVRRVAGCLVLCSLAFGLLTVSEGVPCARSLCESPLGGLGNWSALCGTQALAGALVLLSQRLTSQAR